MPSMKLTKSAVDSARPDSTDFELRDTVVPGFLCKITPAGRKVFMLSYRTPTGERRKPSLGTYGQITVDQARKLAQDFLASVRGGADPSQERQIARTAPTVKDLADRFMVEHSEARNKPSTVRGKRDYYVQSRLGNRLFDLGLGPVALAFVAASTPADHAMIDDVLTATGPAHFASSWLVARDLAWAADLNRDIEEAGIQEVVLFHSANDELLPYQGRFPFDVIGDPDQTLYRRYGVGRSIRAVLDPRALAASVKGNLRKDKPKMSGMPEGGVLGLPADFLVRPDGTIKAAHYGKHADDQWTVDEMLTLARA